MIKKTTDKHTINWLKRSIKDIAGATLPADVKSNIVYSLLAGIPAPMIILEGDTTGYGLVSGGDFVNSVMDFIHGGFSIEKNDIYEAEIGKHFVGKTFFDFSDEEKDIFLELEVVVIILRPLTDNQRKAVEFSYSRINVVDAVAVVSATSQIDITLEKYLAHKFFEAVNISSPSIDLITQFLMINEQGTTTELRVKDIIAFKESITEEPNINNELDYLAKAYTEKTIYLKKTHLPMIFVCARVALADKVKPVKFKEIMDKFFEDMSEEYKKACDSSSSRSKANTRLKVLIQYYKDNK